MRTLTVTGTGAVSVVPDTAVVRVAAVHRAPGLAAALEGAERARAAVVAAATGLVVGSADLSVWPAHDQEGRPAGFEARHALVVTCPDVEAAGALLTRLADEVGDDLQVEGVSLAVGDPGGHAGPAREAATADARDRAEHLAGLLGEHLDVVQQVVEGGAPGPGVPRSGVLAKVADVSLAPGETSIGATVTITWSLVD